MDKKKKAGRKPKISADADEFSNAVVAKLKDAFLDNLSIENACIEAGIDDATFYRHYKKNENFARKIDYWRGNQERLALRNITKELEKGNVELSKWTVERLRDDYKTKTKQEITGDVNVAPTSFNILPVKSNNEL